MIKLFFRTGVIAGLIFFTSCDLNNQEDTGQNNPAELVGKWERSELQVGLEVTTNSQQDILDLGSAGTGGGITITGDNVNETLQYINPIFIFMMMDSTGMDMNNGNGMDQGPRFLFAAQNLDWSVYQRPEDFFGQRLKMFVLMEDHIYDPVGNSMMDSLISRAVYFEWTINDTDAFFMDNQPPDSMYMAEGNVNYTLDTLSHQLTVSNLNLYFARFSVLVDNDSAYQDTIEWDSSRAVTASGTLAPATLSIPANTPTMMTTPFFDEKQVEGPPVSVDLHDDGSMDFVEVLIEYDQDGNKNEVTNYLTGNWWTEGADTLVMVINDPQIGPDTVDLNYSLSGTELMVVHKEDPCDPVMNDNYPRENCMADFEQAMVGLQTGSLEKIFVVMNVKFLKLTTGKIAPGNGPQTLDHKQLREWMKRITRLP